ncbi:STAS domain-containing protein [Mangrovihabitans endophyticus]|uniref:Anti-sigma factor antagonist n=1 Tax=Mangrovihabitans endophyticus TaxID=1751298 RepID=A0A8J3BZ30_9ACTN|nr:STAS domain-containing protein [Mangrovihabitans endophyticus]GGK86821.1 anti-sigma factor antagonist [Mangrovihabitans endophyticus]
MTEQPATSLDRDDGTVTVRLHGEVDVLTVDEVRMALAEAIRSRPASVVVDLADLTFIDSTGLGAIVFGFQRAREADIAFALARPPAGIHRLLVLSGVLEVIKLSA